MKRLHVLLPATAALIALACPIAQAQWAWRWHDDKGHMVYSDAAPPPSVRSSRALTRSTRPPILSSRALTRGTWPPVLSCRALTPGTRLPVLSLRALTLGTRLPVLCSRRADPSCATTGGTRRTHHRHVQLSLRVTDRASGS